jgi:hypothetical protein
VIFVFVREKHGMQAIHAVAQHLLAKIWAAIDDDIDVPFGNHDRRTQAIVTRILRSADCTMTCDHGYAL